MNWLDIVLGLIVVASVLSSFRKGLSREIIGIVTVCFATLLGIWLYGSVAGYLIRYVSSRTAANFAGFAIVFGAVLVAGSLLGSLIGRFFKLTGLSFFDHVLGLGFGAIRGLLIGVAVITGIMAFSSNGRPPAEVVHSRMAPYFLGGSRVVAAMAPHELKEGFRKSYQSVQSAWSHISEGPVSRREGQE
jgi:membrane protein required for colicin V production